jgi:hypothetical protein
MIALRYMPNSKLIRLHFRGQSVASEHVRLASSKLSVTPVLFERIISPPVVNTDKIINTVGLNTRCCYRVVVTCCSRVDALQTPYYNERRAFNRENTSCHYTLTNLPAFLFVLRLAMDVFVFYSKYYVLVHKPCAYTVTPPHLTAHIVTKDANNICSKDSLHRANKIAAMLVTRIKAEYNFLNPATSLILRLLPI